MSVARAAAAVAASLVATVVVLGFRAYEGRATESRLSSIASEIAGRDVRVRCYRSAAPARESGSVMFDAHGRPADVARLDRDVCSALTAFARSPSGERFACVRTSSSCELEVLETLQALQTLAHEAWHLRGERSEPVAECYAIQTVAFVAKRFGAGARDAQAAARGVLAELYPRMPGEYQSRACHNGGRLDLRPGSPVWP